VAGAVIVFLSLAAYVAFNGVPFGGNGDNSSTVGHPRLGNDVNNTVNDTVSGVNDTVSGVGDTVSGVGDNVTGVGK
jgi:hypothetical protein